MTKNSLYCIGTIRGTSTYEMFIQAKSVDKLKEKLCKKIDDICKKQNNRFALANRCVARGKRAQHKIKAGSFIPTIFE